MGKDISDETNLDSIDAGIKVNSNTTIDNNANVSVESKVSVVEVKLSVNFQAIGQWFVETMNTIGEMFMPEIYVNTNNDEYKYDYETMSSYFVSCVYFVHTTE